MVEAGAAQLDGNGATEEAERRHLVEDVAREGFLLVVVLHARRHDVPCEVAH